MVEEKLAGIKRTAKGLKKAIPPEFYRSFKEDEEEVEVRSSASYELAPLPNSQDAADTFFGISEVDMSLESEEVKLRMKGEAAKYKGLEARVKELEEKLRSLTVGG
jgi:hypothetical protein